MELFIKLKINLDYKLYYSGAKMGHRKRLDVYVEDERIYIKDKDGKMIQDFKHNPNVKTIKNFNTQKSASEKAILEYYKKQAKGHVYKPTTKEEFNKRFEVFVDSNKRKKPRKADVKEFNIGSRLLFANQRRIHNYDYMYVQVVLKIHFDGHYDLARGRSDYYYKDDVRFRSYKKGIPRSELHHAILQATKRALAPYGSNLDFRFVKWQYVYHQPPLDDQRAIRYVPEQREEFASRFR